MASQGIAELVRDFRRRDQPVKGGYQPSGLRHRGKTPAAQVARKRLCWVSQGPQQGAAGFQGSKQRIPVMV